MCTQRMVVPPTPRFAQRLGICLPHRPLEGGERAGPKGGRAAASAPNGTGAVAIEPFCIPPRATAHLADVRGASETTVVPPRHRWPAISVNRLKCRFPRGSEVALHVQSPWKRPAVHSPFLWDLRPVGIAGSCGVELGSMRISGGNLKSDGGGLAAGTT